MKEEQTPLETRLKEFLEYPWFCPGSRPYGLFSIFSWLWVKGQVNAVKQRIQISNSRFFISSFFHDSSHSEFYFSYEWVLIKSTDLKTGTGKSKHDQEGAVSEIIAQIKALVTCTSLILG